MQAMRSHGYVGRGVQIHFYAAGTRNSPKKTVPNARNSAGALRPLDGSPGKKERMLAKKQHEARATSEASVEDCCWVYWTIP